MPKYKYARLQRGDFQTKYAEVKGLNTIEVDNVP